jgi:hypothetical protein
MQLTFSFPIVCFLNEVIILHVPNTSTIPALKYYTVYTDTDGESNHILRGLKTPACTQTTHSESINYSEKQT